MLALHRWKNMLCKGGFQLHYQNPMSPIGEVFFARHISQGQKWWWIILGREISCNQWEGPRMHSSALLFFLLSCGGGGNSSFPWFSMCFHYVPIKFPKFPNLLPNIFSIAPHFYLVWFGKCCPPFTYIGGPKGRNSILQNRTLFWGDSIISFFLSDGPIKLAHCNK